MKKYLLILFIVSGCSTPVTTLADKKGKMVTCGGVTTVIGGFIGYRIQESEDRNCVDQYKAQGYHVE